jgi:integrase/recombinase XerD
MEKLIEKMKMDLELQDYSQKTVKSYLWHIRDFYNYFKGAVTDLGEDDIRKYLYHIKHQKGYGRSYLSQAYSSIKFLYRETIDIPISLNKLRGPKRMIRLPVIFSQEEVKRLFNATDNVKHKTILMVTYAGGLRVNEVAHLKVNDIDSDRMQIRVRQGKGRKDRYTLLSPKVLKRLQEYWRTYRPKDWLFPSRRKVSPICTSTIQRVFKQSKKKAGIQKEASVHTLRHSFATHLLEQGVNLFVIQKLLGHKYIQSTLVYLHLQTPSQCKVVSPIEQILEV